MKLDHYLTPYTTIKSKVMEDLNVRSKTIKLLEQNIHGKFLDIGLRDDFLDLTPKTKATKTKMKQRDYIILKSLCTANEAINKMKSNLLNRRKYLQIIYLKRG